MPKGNGPNAGTDYTGLSSFGTDADGEMYFCQMSSIGGRIFRLQRGGPPPPVKTMPALLSQTGLFADLTNLQPADFLIPYTVNSPLWSDGAAKDPLVHDADQHRHRLFREWRMDISRRQRLRETF